MLMNNEQLENYIKDYGKEIYSFCKTLTKNKTDADDLYQDTFLKAIELNNIDTNKNPKSYLLGIAVNMWRSKKRRYARRERIAPMQSLSEDASIEQLPVSSKPLDELMIEKMEKEKVRTIIESLPEKMKLVILLYYMDELTLKEIAQILKIPSGTVKSRLHQARKKITKEMEVYRNE